jgi:hypothetical protein
VTSVSTLPIGQIRANACPPSFDESAMTTTRRARATMRLFIAASPSWCAAAPSSTSSASTPSSTTSSVTS